MGRAPRWSGAVNEDCLKLTTYFGERHRANGGFLADAFTDIYARHKPGHAGRGVSGVGALAGRAQVKWHGAGQRDAA
jgi:hypothetical protein